MRPRRKCTAGKRPILRHSPPVSGAPTLPGKGGNAEEDPITGSGADNPATPGQWGNPTIDPNEPGDGGTADWM